MKVLSLDLAISTMGWATSVDGEIDSGIESFQDKKNDLPGDPFIKFRQWLQDKYDELNGVDFIAYEQPHHRGRRSTQVLLGLESITQEKCAEWKIDFDNIHSKTLKKFSTGYGNCKKEDMLEEARNRFPGKKVEDHNEADALLVLLWALNSLGESNGD